MRDSQHPLRGQLSGTLAAAAVVAALRTRSQPLDPALRAALSAQPHQGGPSTAASLPFAARAAIDPDNPEATLEMFRRRRSGISERAGNKGSGGALGRCTSVGATDSARHTETEAGTPTSEGSLIDLLEEGWSGQHGPIPPGPPAKASAAAPTLAAQHSQQIPGSAFAAPAAQQAPMHGSSSLGSVVGSRVPSPMPSPQRLPPWRRPDLLVQVLPSSSSRLNSPEALPAGRTDSTRSTGADTAYYSTTGGAAASGWHGSDAWGTGADTPRSAVSWTSALTLPQTEAELQRLDLREVEALAAEAAALQARAATALRLARQRMQAGEGEGDGTAGMVAGGGGGASGDWQSYVPGAEFKPQVGGMLAGDSAVDEVAEAAARTAPADRQLEAAAAAPAGGQPAAAAPAPAGHQPAAAGALSAGRQPAPAAAAAPGLPQLLLQICLLLLAATEVAILSGAAALARATGGRVQLPSGLVIMPVGVARAALFALFVALEALLHALRGTSGGSYRHSAAELQAWSGGAPGSEGRQV